MHWGFPPLIAMVFAGHTDRTKSAHLQASLGYARLWYNCTLLIPIIGFSSYFISVVPGCIGAGRKDRIPRYFQRSLVYSVFMLSPCCALQLVAGPILLSVGVNHSDAHAVAVYSKIMIISALLNLVNVHMQAALNNLGYVRCAMLPYIFTAIAVDSTAHYMFVLRWGWGMYGVAAARILVQFTHLVVFMSLISYLGLSDGIYVAPTAAEQLLSRTELKEYLRVGVPALLANSAGWLVIELQILAITNIRGIPEAALAAGALWAQLEAALSSLQVGWDKATAMRCLELLGSQDPGARKVFWLFHSLSVGVVAALNIMVLLVHGMLVSVASNDIEVQHWLGKIVWILIVHMQINMSGRVTALFYIPLGNGMLKVLLTFVTFYFIAAPLVGLVALSDIVTSSASIKFGSCYAAPGFAQLLMIGFNVLYIRQLDWQHAGEIINRRANTDRHGPNANPPETALVSELSEPAMIGAL